MSNENRTIYLTSFEPVSIEIENGAILQFSLSKPLPKKLTIIIKPTDDSSTTTVPLPPPEVEPDGTIRGYPNCKVGECNSCHVVSCDIYQGYRKAP